MNKFALFLLVASVAFLGFGCGSSPSTSPGTTTGSGNTFQSLANQGKVVYSNKCVSCHAANGQGTGVGPAVWGANYQPGIYNGSTLFAPNGQAMLNFISSSMPLNSPGSLSHSDAVNVLCYLLVQDNQVTPSAAFDESQLINLALK
ncbi:thiosulfate dehydrogenase [Dehalogenimonas formicexedens]|uniref:Thiosulfate dehydrogenase n=1 Tax=Dehalogenimonas formicexedens TaxID=1839801 RepID=A0A1P8F5K4_9CHLR|nr:c-type cytochrome [Dehalogenimonas formicexedens]APV43761.1 thiosulfate dehydrogenase [Dehalogenimonas formicexedens]